MRFVFSTPGALLGHGLHPRCAGPLVAALLTVVLLGLSAPNGQAQVAYVQAEQKISETAGGFSGSLDNGEQFGTAVARLGDVDGDGVADLAVGVPFDDGSVFSSTNDRGAGWIVFLNADGTVKEERKLTNIEITDQLFGHGVAGPGDLDGDGVPDLVVGRPSKTGAGSAHVYLLNTDGSTKQHVQINVGVSSIPGVLSGDRFGFSVAALGDLDGDDVPDLAVGAVGDDDGGTDQGAVWILFMNADGTVKDQQVISETQGGFTGNLSPFGLFGYAVAALGDVDGDGVADLAVGDDRDHVWLLFLNTDGTVKAYQEISAFAGGFTGMIDAGDQFSRGLAGLGDLDGDGVPDLAVGNPYDDSDGGTQRGALWILLLNADGTVKAEQKISELEGDFGGPLHDYHWFGRSLASMGDLDGDGRVNLAVGAPVDNDGGNAQGAVWLLNLGDPLLGTATPLDGPGGLPVAQPVAVASSGALLDYEATVTNATGGTISTEAWVAYVFPDGSVLTKRNALPLSLGTGADFEVFGTITVPGSFPSGTYHFVGYTGIHPDGAIEEFRVTFEKAAARHGAPTLTPGDIARIDLADLATFEVVEASATAVTPEGHERPGSTVLSAAYPNPFNPSTTLRFDVPETAVVRLAVYDMIGREVVRLVDGRVEAGSHAVVFDASPFPSGIYLVRMTTESGRAQTQRLTLIK